MKKIVKNITLLFATLALFSCAPKVIVSHAAIVPPVAPRIEAVSRQAKEVTTQAAKTTVLAQTVGEKYKGDADVVAVVESAKKTEEQSKQTEFQLGFLQEYAKKVDIAASELSKENDEKDITILTTTEKQKKAENLVAVEKAKVSAKNGYLAAASVVILGLLALILKPWKWFI